MRLSIKQPFRFDCLRYTASNETRIKVWTNVVMACFKVLQRTKANHATQNTHYMARQKFKPRTSGTHLYAFATTSFPALTLKLSRTIFEKGGI